MAHRISFNPVGLFILIFFFYFVVDSWVLTIHRLLDDVVFKERNPTLFDLFLISLISTIILIFFFSFLGHLSFFQFEIKQL